MTKTEIEKEIKRLKDKITETRKETSRNQKTMDGGKLLELVTDYLKDAECFEIIHRKDNELIITFYNPLVDTTSETTKIIKWEVKEKCKKY